MTSNIHFENPCGFKGSILLEVIYRDRGVGGAGGGTCPPLIVSVDGPSVTCTYTGGIPQRLDAHVHSADSENKDSAVAAKTSTSL